MQGKSGTSDETRLYQPPHIQVHPGSRANRGWFNPSLPSGDLSKIRPAAVTNREQQWRELQEVYIRKHETGVEPSYSHTKPIHQSRA